MLKIGDEFLKAYIDRSGYWIVFIARVVDIAQAKKRYLVEWRNLSGQILRRSDVCFADAPDSGDFIQHESIGIRPYSVHYSDVTLDDGAAAPDESVTDGCEICGSPKSPRAKTCSPKCRKALSRLASGWKAR